MKSHKFEFPVALMHLLLMQCQQVLKIYFRRVEAKAQEQEQHHHRRRRRHARLKKVRKLWY